MIRLRLSNFNKFKVTDEMTTVTVYLEHHPKEYHQDLSYHIDVGASGVLFYREFSKEV